MTESILAARQVGKAFDGRQVLTDISASFAAGSVIGVLGKNGAGKTTLLEIALGFSPASSGSVQLWGHESVSLPSPIKGRIGYVPQQDELIPLLTGTQQVALTASLHRNWDHELIARLAKEWEVPLERRISVLSGGERQKISMLLALGHRPDLLVLDEPLASLDPIARRSFLRQLLEITADQTHAVIFSSHIISDLERVANEVWILRDGRMAWQGDLDALKESVVRLHLRAREPLYSGLMHVRGWRVLDILCGFVLFAAWLTMFVTTQLIMSKPWLTSVLIAAIMGVAFGLRLIAVHRWQRIDWLVCKLPRPAARDEVRLAS